MPGSSSTIRILAIAPLPPGCGPPWPTLSPLAGHRGCLLLAAQLADRQCDGELAALSGRAVHRNLSPMRLRDVPYQRQPQPASLGVMHQRIAHPVELLENLFLLAIGDPY